MKKLKRCFNCNAVMEAYPWTFAERHLVGLKALWKKGGGPIKLKDLPLNRNYWNQFYFLKYWDLVDYADEEKKTWVITQKGIGFLTGNIKIEKRIWIYRKQRVLQPADNDLPLEYISVDDVKLEIMTKEKAIATAAPYNRQLTLL